MCPFRESIYAASKDIRTIELPTDNDGRTPSVRDDDTSKYQELRKCYYEQFFGPDNVEEDRRFKNWRRWIEERKKIHAKLGERVGRHPSLLVMNSSEGRRTEEEMKALIHYAQTIVKPDPMRGGPDFWKPPMMLPDRRTTCYCCGSCCCGNVPCCCNYSCCCAPPVEVKRPPEEVGKIPVLEHVGVPQALRAEKGLIGNDLPDVRKRWMRSDYLEQRASALRRNVLYLRDHFPDTSLIVQGHAFGVVEEDDTKPRNSIEYKQALEDAWAERALAKARALSFICPVDSAVLHWHVDDVRTPPTSDQQQAYDQVRRITEQQWAHVAEMAERLGSVVVGGQTVAKPPQQEVTPRLWQIPPPPLLVVTAAPPTECIVRSMKRQTGGIALAEGPETEIEPQLLVRVVIDTITLWREPPHLPPVAVFDSEAKDDLPRVSVENTDTIREPVYHSSHQPRWKMELETRIGQRTGAVLKFENTGSLAVEVRWTRDEPPHPLPGGGLMPQAFYVHQPHSICPPGQSCDLNVSFYSSRAGLFHETWLLESEPRIAPPCTRLPLELWGIVMDPAEDLAEHNPQLRFSNEPHIHDQVADRNSVKFASLDLDDDESFMSVASRPSCTRVECPSRLPTTTIRESSVMTMEEKRKAAVEHAVRAEAEMVKERERMKQELIDTAWPKASCNRADCVVREKLKKMLVPPWPLGKLTQREIHEYLDMCTKRAEVDAKVMRLRRFGDIKPQPPYRSCFINQEVFEHLNPGYFYRAEPIGRLRDVWRAATGKKREQWDLSLNTLRHALKNPRHGKLSEAAQEKLMEDMFEATKDLQVRPPIARAQMRGGLSSNTKCSSGRAFSIRDCAEQKLVSASERRWGRQAGRGRRIAYSSAYGALCCLANSMDSEAHILQMRFGLVKPPTSKRKVRTRAVNSASTIKTRHRARMSHGTSTLSTSHSTTAAAGATSGSVAGGSGSASTAPPRASGSIASMQGARTRSQSRTRAKPSRTALGARSNRDVHISKSTITNSMAGSVVEISDGESTGLPSRTPDTVNNARAQYRASLYAKTYHLLSRAVEQIAGAVDATELLDV